MLLKMIQFFTDLKLMINQWKEIGILKLDLKQLKNFMK